MLWYSQHLMSYVSLVCIIIGYMTLPLRYLFGRILAGKRFCQTVNCELVAITPKRQVNEFVVVLY